jgi:hypothetical protein
MTIEEAQQDFRRAYVGGGPGVLVSGLVWLLAAVIAHNHGIERGFAALFIGGMAIHPVSTFACRKLFNREKEVAGNPFPGTAVESTVAMIGGLVAAWLFIPLRADFVFPIAAIAVGTRYAIFKTLYGDRLFWLLGGLMTGVGLLVVFDLAALPAASPFVVGAIEVVVAAVLLMRVQRSEQLMA